MKKKLTAILLSLLMSVQALPFYALAEEAETPAEGVIALEMPEVYSEQDETYEYDDGCADCADAELSASTSHSHDDYTAWTSTTSMPTTAGKYYLTADVSISSQWSVPSGTTTLCLNGYTLKQTGNSRVINIASGCNLVLEDCNGANRTTLFDYGSNNVYVPSEIGLYTVTGGMIYGGINQSDGGGGVFVAAGGTFTMNGGNIVGCLTTINGGGVMVSGGTFTMNGGMIFGNAASGMLGGCGGGVAVSGNGAYFYFYGGQIKSNYASLTGSAVYTMSSGMFTVNGGSIMYNHGKKYTIYNNGGTVNYYSGKFNNHLSGAEDYYSPMPSKNSSRRIFIYMNDGTENTWKDFYISYGEALPDIDELPQRKGYSATGIYDDPVYEHIEDVYNDNCYFTPVDGIMKGRDHTGWDYYGAGKLYIHWHKHTLTDDYVDLGDGTHKQKCSECGEYDLPEAHTFDGDYVDNGNGTHSRKCACGARGPQIAHSDFDEHACGLCGGTEKVSKTTTLPYMQIGRIEDSTAYSYEFDDFTVTADYCGDYGLYAGHSGSYDDRVTITANRSDICITGVDYDISYIGYPEYLFKVGYSSGVRTDTFAVDDIQAGMTVHVAGIDASSFSFVPLDLGKYYVTTMVVHYTVDAHTYGDEYRDNEDGTHSPVCTVCGECGEPETHSFSSGVYHNNEDGTHSEKCTCCDAYGAPEHTETVVFNKKCLASEFGDCAYTQTGTDFKISATKASLDGIFIVGMGRTITFEAINTDAELKRIEMTLTSNAGNAVHLTVTSGDAVEGADAKDGDTLHIIDINASTFMLAANAYVYVKDIVIHYSLGETSEPHDIVNHVCVCGESTEHSFTGDIRDNFDGTHSRQCTDCGEWTTGVAHTFVNHVCSVCGVYEAVSEDLTENFAFDPVFIDGGEYFHEGKYFTLYSNCTISQGIRGGGKLDNSEVYPVIRIESKYPDLVITQVDYTEGYGCGMWPRTGISAGYKQTSSSGGVSSGWVRRVYKIMRPVFSFEGGGESSDYTITAKAITVHYAHINHNFTGDYYDNEDGTHSQKCTDCDAVSEPETHSYTDHECICGKTVEHVFDGEYKDNGDGTHSQLCIGCGEYGNTKEHSFVNHVCACGATSEHSFTGACHDNEDGTHTYQCENCGVWGTPEAHSYTDHVCACGKTVEHDLNSAYKDNGDGTHSQTCIGCGECGTAEDHTFVDHECVCGATNDHSFTGACRDNGDGTHSRKCTGCGEYDTAEKHTYVDHVCACGATNDHDYSGAIRDNGDGTHSFACKGCDGYGNTEAHNYVNGACACGATSIIEWTNANALPTANGVYRLGTDVTLAAAWEVPSGVEIKLDLNGHTISRNLSAAVYNGYVIATSGKLTLTDSSADHTGLITGGYNSSSGGGISVKGGSLTMENITVRGNKTNSNAGGINISSSATVVMTDCHIDGNSANAGGGILNSGMLTVNGGSMSGNTATSRAGGLYIDSAIATFTDCEIKNNRSESYGGAVFENYYATVTLDGCTVTGNSAKNGGGACGMEQNSSKLNLKNTAVTGNSVDQAVDDLYMGGGILYKVGSLTLDGDVIIFDNTCAGEISNICIINDSTISASSTFVASTMSADSKIGCNEKVLSTIVGITDSNVKALVMDNGDHVTREDNVLVTHTPKPVLTGECIDNGDGTHSFACELCTRNCPGVEHSYVNHVCACGNTVEHAFTGEYKDNGDGTHARICIGCGEYGTSDAHTFVDHVCVCGAVTEHSFTGEYKDNEDGTHVRKCTDCDEYGGAEEHTFIDHVCACGAVSEHSFTGEYKDNEDGTHVRKCTDCDEYGGAEEHTFVDHVCVCGAVTEHSFTGEYRDNGDGTHARKCIGCDEYSAAEAHNEVNHVCTICNLKVSEHSFNNEYVNNGDGSHKQQCTGCGEYSPATAHTFVNGVCACGVTSPMKWTSTNALPTYSGEYVLDSNVNISSAWNIPNDVAITLDLNGHTISRGLSGTARTGGNVITVSGTLNIVDNSDGQTGKITGGNNSGDGGAISIIAGSVTMENITVSGNAAGNGGAIYVAEGASLDMTDCHIDGNKAGGTGGIFNSGTLTVTGGSISGNTTTGNVGAVYTNKTSTTTITDCEIKNNICDMSGGAFYIDGTSTVLMEGCTISGNMAKSNAGAMYIPSASAKVTLTDCHIDGNSAGGSGGIYNNGTLIVNGGTVNGNSATGNSGGLYCGGGSATFTDCEIKDNRSDNYGGAFFVDYTSSLTLDGCTVTGNSAMYGGGAIEMEKAGSTLVLEDTEITGNSVDQVNGGWYKGGGIHYYLGSITLKGDVILYGNTCAETVSNLCYRNQSVTYNASALSANSMVGTPETVLSVITGITESNVSGLILENGDHVTIESGSFATHTPEFTGEGIDNEDGTHSLKCTVCGKFGAPEEHTYTDHVCVCGNTVEHAFTGEYRDNGDGTHSRLCLGCGEYGATEAHNEVNHVCTICNLKVSEHDFTDNYVNNGDGSHKQQCTGCGEFTPSVPHIYVNGVCDCGQTSPMAWTNTAGLPAYSGEYRLEKDVTLTGTWNVSQGTEITLDLNGHTIKRSLSAKVSGGNVISTNGDLTLIDTSAEHTGLITGGNNSGDGGAISIIAGSVTMENITVSGNAAGNGGAIHVASGATLDMTDCHITGNTASGNAGGIYNNGNVTIEGGSISGNKSNGYAGGFFENTGSASITDCKIENNRSENFGGAFFINVSAVTLDGSTVSGNTAKNGGGAIEMENSGAGLVVKNSAITGNSADSPNGGMAKGGGIHYRYGTLTLVGDVTITDNNCAGSANNICTRGFPITFVASDMSADSEVALNDGALAEITGITESNVNGLIMENGDHVTIESGSFATHAPDFTGECTDNGDGTHTFMCSKCTRCAPAEAHTFVDYTCSGCGAEMEPVVLELTSIRTSGTTGLRFAAYVTDEELEASDSCGFIVARENTDLAATPEHLVFNDANSASGTNTFGITYTSGETYNKEKGINKFYATDGEAFGMPGVEGNFFTGVMTGVPKAYYAEHLIARPYMVVGDVTLYGDCYSKSLYENALALKNAGYPGLDDAGIAYVDEIIAAVEG